MCCLSIIFMLFILITGLSLVSFYFINSTSGDIVLGNTDVVLITKSNDSTVILSTTSDSEMTNISVYHELCSEIGQIQQVSNSSSQLTVSENMTYRIEEVYLIGTSQVAYNFTIASSQATASCVANVSIFLDYTDYTEFLTSGHARNPNKSHCLSSNEPLDFELNSFDGDSYHFVGLKSFVSATLNYTVSKELLEYDVTNASNVSCTISPSSSECTISLNGEGQEMCVLASLQHTNNTFITLSYESNSRLALSSVGIIILSNIGMSFIIINVIIIIFLIRMRKVKLIQTVLTKYIIINSYTYYNAYIRSVTMVCNV